MLLLPFNGENSRELEEVSKVRLTLDLTIDQASTSENLVVSEENRDMEKGAFCLSDITEASSDESSLRKTFSKSPSMVVFVNLVLPNDEWQEW